MTDVTWAAVVKHLKIYCVIFVGDNRRSHGMPLLSPTSYGIIVSRFSVGFFKYVAKRQIRFYKQSTLTAQLPYKCSYSVAPKNAEEVQS